MPAVPPDPMGTPPLRVYGASISYYTGKLEAYLRYKGIAYQRIAMVPSLRRRIRRITGADQMPAVELEDGRFLTDTTPTIEWLERQHPEPPVIPRDPLQAFVSRLLEDYAEEWLWRPAMHYRWSHRADRLLVSRRIADELLGAVPLPGFAKRALLAGIPVDLWPILDEAGSAYLPYLDANARAWQTGVHRFDTVIQGVRYRRLPVSQYRVWCLERLRAGFEALPEPARGEARALLAARGCLAPLFAAGSIDSRYDPEGRVPFRGRKVHYDDAR